MSALNMYRSLEIIRRSAGSVLPALNHLRPQTCCFSLNHPVLNIKREARFMKKIMGRHESKKKMFFFDRMDGPPPSSSAPRPYNQRRMSMLNKLFMKNITEVLATGSSKHTLEGLGVDISKVAIAPDFKVINVFYLCKKKPLPEDLQQKLTDAGYSLRHDLSQLRLMGEVPRVVFVEDRTLQRLEQIEEILSTADKGSDEPSQDSEEDSLLLEEENLELFNASQRAYGLNHTKILDKILSAKKAASPHKRRSDTIDIQEGVPFSPSETVQTSLTKGESGDLPRRFIAKFLKENKTGRAPA